MTALSKTDKTRPFQVKLDEARARDPYGARSHYYPYDEPGIWGCPTSCWMCVGWRKEENRRIRREGKKLTRDWQKDY